MPRLKGSKDKTKRRSRAEPSPNYMAERNVMASFLGLNLNDQELNLNDQEQALDAGPPQEALAEDVVDLDAAPPPPIIADGDHGVLITDHQVNGVIDLADVEPDFDDNPDNPGGGNITAGTIGTGYMAQLMKKIQVQLGKELSSKADTARVGIELLSHLKTNNFWIRAETLSKFAILLGEPPVTGVNCFYLRDIKVWLPDTQFGKESMPCCISCGSNHNVDPHGWPGHHPARRIITFNTTYFLMSRQYKCSSCEKANSERKEAATITQLPGQRTLTGEPVREANLKESSSKIQYTFMGSHEECLKRFRHAVRDSFPAILSAKSGLDKVLASCLRPLSDKGLAFKAMEKWLLELHSLRYSNDLIAHQDQQMLINRGRTMNGLASLQDKLSDYNDPNGYNGAIPKHTYLSDMYKRYHRTIQSHIDKQQKFQVSCDMLAVDASFKATRKMTQTSGKRIFNAMITLANEDGMIRSQVASFSDSHEQIKGALQAINLTNKQIGKDGPRLIFTDKPGQDKHFFLEAFPESLPASQRQLDAMAEARNRNHLIDLQNASNAANGEAPTLEVADSMAQSASFVEEAGIQEPGDDVVVARHTTKITEKINALSDFLDEDQLHYFSLDSEWDTEQWDTGVYNPYAKKRGKSGKVPLVQISYRLPDAPNTSRALILQLNPRDRLPPALKHFLTRPNHIFVGVRVKHDVEQLFNDYNIDKTLQENKVRVEELGRWAKRRDLVKNAGCSLSHLSSVILGKEMNKDEKVRCSKWSSNTLTQEQIRYAADDVIIGLDIFMSMHSKPDLTQRLDPEVASRVGTIVDLVPPHARGNKDKIQRGYGHDHDLTTRAAVGEIVQAGGFLQMRDASIRPSKIRGDPLTTCQVKVTEVLAPTLVIPQMRKVCNDGRESRQACLGDFGDVPFEIIVPCSMLREHEESASVRNYGGLSTGVQFAMTTRATSRTPPSRDHIVVIDEDEGVEANRDEEAEEEIWSELVNDAMEDGALNLVEKSGGDASAITKDLETNARQENLATILESLQQAEVVANRAQFHHDFHLLHCPDLLDDVPIKVLDKFSCVLGDIFHAIDRIKIPIRHEYKKPFKVAMMRAFLEYHPLKLQEVKQKLKDKGWEDDQIEATMFYNPSFFNRRVERIAVPPRQLYYRVRAVLVTFGKRLDSKTSQPLFNLEAWKKARHLLKEILEGYYSDPPGFDFYSYQVDDNGNQKKDCNGISLLFSHRGTSHVEAIHRQYNTMFRHQSGIEMGDALFRERRHRHNIDLSRSRYQGVPKFGHYDTWLIDLVQLLFEQNSGRLLYPGWQNVCDFQDTLESFVTVPLHTEDLQDKLNERVQLLEQNNFNYSPKLTPDMKFLCEAWGVPLPFLPVMRRKEMEVFSRIMLCHPFESEKMSHMWMEYVDGSEVFPKLPSQLREYYKSWERNARIKSAASMMKSDQDLLFVFLDKTKPREFEQRSESTLEQEGEVPPEESATITMTQAQMPGPLPHTIPIGMRLPLDAPRPVVGTIPMAITLPCPEELAREASNKRKHGHRGTDRAKRAARRCNTCLQVGREENALICPGRARRNLCVHIADILDTICLVNDT
jgi:hypothetical protein